MITKPQNSFMPARRWKIGFDMLLRTVLVLAVVVMVNYLGAKFFKRFYLSSEAQQLSPRTLSVVHSITNHVNVIVYYDKTDDWYPMIIELLNEYHTANPNITVKTVDYTLDAGEAQKIKEQYSLNSPKAKNLIIFQCGDRWKIANGDELSQTQIVPNGTEDGRPLYRRKPIAFNGEMLFTAMLLAVENTKPLKAYFLQGDGEPLLSDTGDQGYYKFGQILAQNFVSPEPLQLLGQNNIPDDCNLLIIAGPYGRFSQTELQKIDQYLTQGGRLFMLFNYFSLKQPTGLNPIFAKWGVNVLDDAVKEPTSTTSPGKDVITSTFGQHPAVNPLNGLALQLILPRPIEMLDQKNPPPDAPKVDALAFSTPQSSLEVNSAQSPQSYPLMVAVEQKAVPGVANPRGITRMVVVGDSFFLDNRQIESAANRDFAGYAVNWLLDRTVLLNGIGPRPVTEFRLTMTQTQQTNVRWLLLVILPGGVLAFGWLIWLVRRK